MASFWTCEKYRTKFLKFKKCNNMRIEFDIFPAVMISLFSLLVFFVIIIMLFKRKHFINFFKELNWLSFLVIASTILSLVAFCISVYTIYCCCCCRSASNICCNSDSIVVGAFGVIVTILIGWNIYKGINIDNKIDGNLYNKTEEIKKYLSELVEVRNLENHIANLMLQMIDALNTFDYKKYTYCSLYCLSLKKFLNQNIENDILDIISMEEDILKANIYINIEVCNYMLQWIKEIGDVRLHRIYEYIEQIKAKHKNN